MQLPGDRIQSTPLVIYDNEPAKKLERVSLTGRSLNEDWMQKIIHSYPSLLPVVDVEPVFGPLVSIGREIPVDRGFIDNLFISPQGYLKIVETKLWRNPEARREVVGQIIEYAKEVSTWTFDDLNNKVKDYYKKTTGKSIGVIDAIRTIETICEDDESNIIDAIMRNIKRGRFLLLIVGDGIRESTEELADFLSQTPQLHFTLALVELQIYKLDKGRLVLPQIVTRTKEITRAIIRVEGDKVIQFSVDTDITPDVNPEKHKRYTLSEDDFFEQLSLNAGTETTKFAELLMDAVKELGCDIQMRQSSYVIRFADPSGSKQRLTLLIVSAKGRLYTDYLIDQLKRIELPVGIGEEYLKQIKDTLSGCEVDNSKDNEWKLEQAASKLAPITSAIANVISAIKEAAVN